MFDWRRAPFIVMIPLVLLVGPTEGLTKPFLPRDDAIVLERVPEKGDPALLLRLALAAQRLPD